MTDELPSDPDRGLADWIAPYLERLQGGEELQPEEILASHPDLGPSILEALRSYVDLGIGSESVKLQFADYTLRRELGRGGMGVVYEAWQHSLDRRVALKVLPAGIAADPRASTRFLREAQIAARLQHPHIVSVHASGVEGSTPYYAMDLVEGESLARVLARMKESAADAPTPFGPARTEQEFYLRVARAFADVAEGLQHAHEHKIIHRDLKPSNLILERGGRLKILDFGLAHLEGQATITLSGDVLGTPQYMSPEQARRKKVPVDHRTDIWSLGATLYEALTGQPPFRGRDHHDTLSQIIADEPAPPQQIEPRVPADLETIVLKCLRKEAGDRYGTAEALAQDLRRFVRNEPIEARPEGRWERLARRAQRHQKTIFVSAAVAALAAVCVGLGIRVALDSSRDSLRAYEKAIVSSSMKLLRGEWLLSRKMGRTAEQEVFMPRSYQAHFDSLGRTALATALTELEQAATLVPGRVEAHHLRARCLFLLERKDEALKEAQVALSCDASFAPAQCLLGMLEGREVSVEGASAWARAWQLADTSMRSAKWGKAVEAYGELIALAGREQPDLYPGSSIECHFRRGIARMGAKDYASAVLDFQAARTLLWTRGEESLEALLFLGGALYLNGQRDLAASAFDEALSGGSRAEEASTWIASIYASIAMDLTHRQRHHEAVEAARAAIRYRPQDPLVRVGLGQALLALVESRRNGDGRRRRPGAELAELDEVARAALRLGPENPVAHWFHGKAFDARGDGAGARRAYRRALELDTRTKGDTTMATKNSSAAMALAAALSVGSGGALLGQEGHFELEGPLVNSCVNFGGLQWSVSLSRDGQSLFFASDYAGGWLDLYMASWDGLAQEFVDCHPLASVNSPAWDAGASLSADRTTLYFASTRLANGEFVNDLFTAIWDDGQNDFDVPQVIGGLSSIPGTVSRSSISADGYELFFQVEPFDWSRDIELWVAWRFSLDEPFTRDQARPLTEVNSPHDDSVPLIHGDGKTLFWTGWLTDSHDGGADFTGSSIWTATRSETFDPTRHEESPRFGNVRKLPVVPHTPIYGVAVPDSWPLEGSRIYFVSCIPSMCKQLGSAFDMYSAVWHVAPRQGQSFHRGDPNSSGDIDLSDGITIFGFLFLGNPATLSCKESADANNNGTIDISDGISILNRLFTGSPALAAPGPTGMPCGFDPDPVSSPGDLGCESYGPCSPMPR